jgi:hypothetical protein
VPRLTRSHFINTLYRDLPSLFNFSPTSEWEKARNIVEAGTPDVVGCILEAWWANKGFAIGPDSSATEMLKETREKEFARKSAHTEWMQMEETVEFAYGVESADRG